MLFLSREAEKENGPQIAHQLDLGALRLQREDVVLVKQGCGRQGVIVPGVVSGARIGHNVQKDFHHALLPRQLLRLGGNAVEGVAQSDGPGQVLKGLFCLALKIEVVWHAAGKLEGGAPLPADRDGIVRKVHHLVIDAVVRQTVPAVHGVAFYHAAFQEVSVVIQRGVIRLVIGGGHAIADDLRRCGGQGQRHG